MQKSGGKYLIEPDARKRFTGDRRGAPGISCCWRGRGNEDYQIFADRTIHFDDREVARMALGDRGYKTEIGK